MKGVLQSKNNGRADFTKCPYPPYKAEDLDFSKHGHVAHLNNRIELLSRNLKTFLKILIQSEIIFKKHS